MAGFHRRSPHGPRDSKNGKSDPQDLSSNPNAASNRVHSKDVLRDLLSSCPECASQRVWRDGTRPTRYGDAQRYLCRSCGYRFSEASNASAKPFYKPSSKSSTCQVGASPTPGRVKNLAIVEPLKEGLAGATADIKGKLVELAWWMEKQGYAKETIRGYSSSLRALLHRHANLLDPESVKDALAKEKKWSQNRRRNVINAYTLFLKVNGRTWDKPRCKVVRKIPFIPTEEELDCLISGTSRKVSTFLQLLKETAMRSGEAKRLQRTDVDFERRALTLNQPEKNSLPRIWTISPQLINMLNALPRKSLRIFGDGPINSIKTTFLRARRRLATKLQNPRLLRISFHTFRHWKATMEYHRTKDLLHVMAFLGHKKSDNTLLYVQLDQKLFKDHDDSFHVRVGHNIGEAIGLIEAGYEYVTGECNDGGKLFRKRK